MKGISTKLRNLNLWQIGLLAGILVGAGGASYGLYVQASAVEQEGLKENQQLIPVQFGDLLNQVSTNGNLVFPERETLSFGTAGKVEELLVEDGQQVKAGEVLAKLDAAVIATLAKTVAQKAIALRDARETLGEVAKGYTALEMATAEEDVTQAKFQLQEALEALEDARKPYTLEVIRAQEDLVADAKIALRDAEQALGDVAPKYALEVAQASQAMANAGTTLNDAVEALGNIDLDHAQKLADALRTKANNQVALDQTVAVLDRYERSKSGLVELRQSKIDLEAELEGGQAHLTQLQESQMAGVMGLDVHIRRWEGFVALFQQDFDDNLSGLADLEQRAADVTLAEADLESSETELTKLQLGLDPSDRNDLQEAVSVAQAELAVAIGNLSSLNPDGDPLVLGSKQIKLSLAQASLTQSEEDLAELVLGADLAEVALRESEVTTARAALADVEEGLAELLARPDPLDIDLWKASVTAAAEALTESEQLLNSATLTAPMDGVITLVSVDQGDQVQANATIVEIADPSKVEMDGIVDEIDVLSIKVGAAAKVTLDALPGRELEGELVEISPVAQIQQGVVSFPVRIRINLRNTPRAGDETADRERRPGAGRGRGSGEGSGGRFGGGQRQSRSGSGGRPDSSQDRHLIALSPDLEFREGLSAVANIVLLEEKNVLVIPQQTLRGTPDEPFVQVKTTTGIEERRISLGNRDDFWVAVTGGLKEGDEIVMETKDASTSRFSFRQFHTPGGGGGGTRSSGGGGGDGGKTSGFVRIVNG